MPTRSLTQGIRARMYYITTTHSPVCSSFRFYVSVTHRAFPDWGKYKQRVMSELVLTISYVAAAYTVTFIMTHLLSHSLVTSSLALIIPTFFAYSQLFRIKCIAQTDFEDRVWHAERLRGLKAGSDWNGDGKVEDEERTKESAEWANAVLRGIWPILNPDLYVS